MKIRSPKNVWAGLLFTVLGLVSMSIARENYELGSAVNMGPGYFPTALGGLLVVFGIVIAASSLVVVGPRLPKIHIRPLLLVLLACVAYGYLLKPAGLVFATAAMVFISSFGGHEFKLKQVSILAAFLVLFTILVFVIGLNLPLSVWPEFLS